MKIKAYYSKEEIIETPDEKIKPLIDYINDSESLYNEEENEKLIDYFYEVQDKVKGRLDYIEYYDENTKKWELLVEE